MSANVLAYDYDSVTAGVSDFEYDAEPDDTERNMLHLLSTYVTLIKRYYVSQWKEPPANVYALRKKSFYPKLHAVAYSLQLHNISVEEYVKYCLSTWPTRNKPIPRDKINVGRTDKNRLLGIECPSVSFMCREKVLKQFLRQYEEGKKTSHMFSTQDEISEHLLSAGKYRLAFLCDREGISEEDVLSDIVFLGEFPIPFLEKCSLFWQQESKLKDLYGLTCHEYIEYRIQDM